MGPGRGRQLDLVRRRVRQLGPGPDALTEWTLPNASTPRPTVTFAAKAAAWFCSNRCPRRCGMETPSTPSSKAPRSTRMVAATASPHPTRPPRLTCCAKPCARQNARRPTLLMSSFTARERLSAIRSNSRPWPRSWVRRRRPVPWGQSKTNLGHLESAAGIASLLKTVLQIHHGEVAPHLHLRETNPLIAIAPARASIYRRRWNLGPNCAGADRAGVSSFGFGGTNAHVIVAQAAASETPPPDTSNAVLLPLSRARPRRCVNWLSVMSIGCHENDDVPLALDVRHGRPRSESFSVSNRGGGKQP